ncbi:MAG TPA: ThuA domain-containing protein [Sedimentisphaerales bacterium]|nr:ThuA domain-containing protein [Sedimentisphaerales bacterium]
MNHRTRALSACLVIAFASWLAGKGCAAFPAAVPLKALIVTGQSGHDWRLSTPIVKQILEQTNLFEVDVAVSPGEDGDMSKFAPDFAAYDVVVLNYEGDLWSEQTQKAFVDYVSSGGGIVAFHAANNAFPQWKEYNRILGLGGWAGRDERWGPYIRWRGGNAIRDYSPGEGGSHPSKHIIQVVTRAPLHPVMKGLPRMWLHSRDGFNIEMRGPAENLTVLATAYADPTLDGGTGENEPLIFTVNYGRGRVFHTLMGHAANAPVDAMECVSFIVTFQRGAEWAATGKVTQEIPKDFPTSTEVRRWPGYKPPQPILAADGPTVQFDRISSSSLESAGPVVVNVALSSPQTRLVTVGLYVGRDTASRGDDYTISGEKLVFEPGQTTAKVTIHLINDKEHEPAETIILRLSSATNAKLGAKTQHVHTIIDDDGVNWDGKTWYYSDAPTALFVNGQGQLEWEPVDDEQIVVRLPDQRLSKPGDVAEFSYMWLSDGPKTDCNCMSFSGCIDHDVTCTAGTGDFRAGLFDSHGRRYITADDAEDEVFRGYRGYKFYISPHVSSQVGRFRDHTGEVHISGGIYKRKNPDNDAMLLSKNNNYRRLRINGGFDLPLDTFSPLTIRLERLSQESLRISITLNGITYTTVDDDPTDQPQKIDVFAMTFPNARNYTRWVLAVPPDRKS